MRKLLTILTGLALVTALGACGTSGGDDGAAEDTTTTAEVTTTEAETTTTEVEAVDVDEWGASFCGAFGTWLDDIEQATTDVQDVAPGDLEAAQAAMSDLFGNASAATGELIASVEEIGAPDIEDGDRLVEDLSSTFQGFADAADSAQAEVEGLELDLTTFESEYQDLLSRFEDEVTAVGESFDAIDAEYRSDELNQAIADNCTF